MLNIPANLADVELLIRNQVPEDIHLDYKASPALLPAKRDEIAKDVSAFANSDGGLLVYGVEEDKDSKLPVRIDEGVESKWNREWFEQLVASNISPRLDGIEIKEIVLGSGRLIMCVRVPKSFRGPHQSADKRYYKRFNFSSFPMEHYEVEDVRLRKQVSPQLVSLDLESPGGALLLFVLKNIGAVAALDLKFQCAGFLKWERDVPPAQFTRGIQCLPPGKTLQIPYGGVMKIMPEREGNDPQFTIEVTYTNADTLQKTREKFQFDLADFRGTLIEHSDTQKGSREISQRIQELTRAVDKLSSQKSVHHP